jgi:hypothetical protein
MIEYDGPYGYLNELSENPDEELDAELTTILSLSRPEPKLLYHYTTQAGFMGIFKEKAIWATHTQYLNDRSEYSHALNLAIREIDRRVETVKDATIRDFLN